MKLTDEAHQCEGEKCKTMLHPDDLRNYCSMCLRIRTHAHCREKIDKLETKLAETETALQELKEDTIKDECKDWDKCPTFYDGCNCKGLNKSLVDKIVLVKKNESLKSLLRELVPIFENKSLGCGDYAKKHNISMFGDHNQDYKTYYEWLREIYAHIISRITATLEDKGGDDET